MVNLTLEGTTKIYDNQFLAVNEMDLSIEHGEFFTFVGPSGCGKTTTLRMIGGLESVTEGEIYFDDEKVTDLPPQQRDIAMVFQDVILYPHMSVYDNIGYGLKVRGETDEYEEKIREAAEMLDISEQLDKKPSELSGGQQQRVALGRAIVRDPNLILFDEPMSDLDAKLKSELRVQVQQLHRRLDTTMIYVTHDQEEAMTMSDRIGVMNDGVLEQVGTPEEIFNQPENQFISTFIGQPSMNVFDVDIAADGSITAEDGTLLPIDISSSAIDSVVDRRDNAVLGFRPQAAEFVESDKEAVLTATVEVWEPIGTNYICHLSFKSENDIKMVVNEIPADPGEDVKIGNLSRWYLFDSETGDTIYQSGGAELTAELK